MHEHVMPEHFDEAYWNERYRSQSALWSGNPNPLVITETADLTPGAALDVGSGEGADAIWLAQRGWKVTGLDLSTVALERAATHAAQQGAEHIEWLQADLLTWEPAPDRYDLISAQFMHLPNPARDLVFGRLAASVAPGGTLLVVGHHRSDLHTTMQRPDLPDMFFTGDDIAALLDAGEWDVVTNAVVPRSAVDPDGNTVTIQDAVLRARRH
jgi:2-polyprenyl-3-methyl-5-hydroxy-6-metoxy-1,4-benzoquinol methylase